jgi:hypothetical protein
MNEDTRLIDMNVTTLLIIFALPAAIYELRAAWCYFRYGRSIHPLGYHVMAFICLFFHGLLRIIWKG